MHLLCHSKFYNSLLKSAVVFSALMLLFVFQEGICPVLLNVDRCGWLYYAARVTFGIDISIK